MPFASCLPICLLQGSASSSGVRLCLLYLCFLMLAQSLAHSRCSLHVRDVQYFAEEMASLPTHICSLGTKLSFSFFSHVFTALSWVEGVWMPMSYDSDSPNSLMVKTSPPAQWSTPSSRLRESFPDSLVTKTCWVYLVKSSWWGWQVFKNRECVLLMSQTPVSSTGLLSCNCWLTDDYWMT